MQDLLAGVQDDGGRILRVYEIYDWGASDTRTDIFRSMITSLISKKVQAKEGTSLLCAQQKAAMTAAWKEVGVHLSPNGWVESASNYNTAKILLNSVSFFMLTRLPGVQKPKLSYGASCVRMRIRAVSSFVRAGTRWRHYSCTFFVFHPFCTLL